MYIRYECLPDFPKNSVIKNIVFHPKIDIINFIVSSNSVCLRICEYELEFNNATGEPKMKLQAPFFSERIEDSIHIQWSYEGKFLFCVQGKGIKSFILNKSLDQFKLVSNSYKEDSSEILSLGSSRDEKSIFYGTLDGRLVKISTITTKKEEQKFGNKIVSLIVDPLMKFIGVLTLDNKFFAVDFITMNVLKTVDLNLNRQTSELIVYREERKIDMSPNLSYILIPNLDDKKLPIIYAIHRESFEMKYIYGGSFASINCIKFVPKIFYENELEYNYFAFGDAHGNITFWELSNDLNKKNAPLFLLKSDDVTITIENLDFSRDGQIMVGVTNKRFFVVVVLTHYPILQKFKQITKYDFINENCGEFDFRHFEIKCFTEMRAKNELENLFPAQPTKEIVKKLQIRRKKDELAKPIEKEAEIQVDEHLISEPQKLNSVQVSPFSVFQVKMKSLDIFQKSFSFLNDGEILSFGDSVFEYCEEESHWIIKKYTAFQLKWTATFDSPILFVQANEMLVVCYSENGFFYFLDFKSGRRIEMKMYFNSLRNFLVNSLGHILFVKNNGSILLYNFRERIFLFKKNLLPFLESKTKQFKCQKEFEDFAAKNDILNFYLSGEGVFEVIYFSSRLSFDCFKGKWSLDSFPWKNSNEVSPDFVHEFLNEDHDFEQTDPLFNLFERKFPSDLPKAFFY